MITRRHTASQQFFESGAGRWDKIREELFGRTSHLHALAGLMLLRRRRWAGRIVIGLALAALYALSTQYAADRLLQALEPVPADPRAEASGQAIIVLGAGTYFHAPEYGATTVNGNALVRLRYAAHLQRQTGKPVLVTGGSPEGGPAGEGRN